MSGILGTYDLKGGVIQSLCVGDVDGVITSNVSICNRNNETVYVKLAITSTENTFDDDSVYIEYETPIKPKGVLERSALAIAEGKFITIYSDKSSVSAVAYGIRAGFDVGASAVTTNTDTVAPILAETEFLFNSTDSLIEYQLAATNEDGQVFYQTADVIPEGITLSYSGRLYGIPRNGASPATIDVVATDSSGNSSTTAVTINIPNGSSAANAAPSAAFIKSVTNTNTNGTYWIDLPTSGPTEVYCIMDTAADGGGWMLAMKATRGATFEHGASYWTTNNTLNTTETNRNDGDAKFAVFNEFVGNDIAAIMPDATAGGTFGSGVGGWSMHDNSPFENKTLLDVFSGPSIRIRSQGEVDNWIGLGKNASGPFSTQDGFRWQGINYQGQSSNLVRYGFAWNNENDQNSNDVSGGIGMNRQTYSAGDYIGCCQTYNGVNRSMRMELYVR